MPSIALLTAHARFPWFRQIPGGGSKVGGHHVTLQEIRPDCDLLVVYDDPGRMVETTVPRARRMVILSEPPGIRTYRPDYLDQFGIVFGPIEPARHQGLHIHSHPALPWFFGVGFTPNGLVANETMDSLLAMPPPPKIEAISAVISTKAQLPKHRARLKLVEALQARLGERLHVFGRGFREISDKAEAILPYAYHLVLENNDIPHFWTEKTADALLGWALPIVSGCANLADDIGAEAFIPLDIDDPGRATARIESILATAPHGGRLEAIRKARHRILTQHNLFTILAGLAGAPQLAEAPRAGPNVSIRTNADFQPFGRIRKTLRQAGRSLRPGKAAKGPATAAGGP